MINNLYIKAINPSAGGSNLTWTRNPDWLPLPTITSADDRFVGLFIVYEDGYNFVTMTLVGTTLDVDVDWGDTTSVNVTGIGTTISKTYDYTTLGGTIKVDPYTGRNYKQVIIDLVVNSGNLTTLNLCPVTTINNGGVNQFVDLSISHVNVASMTLSNANRRLLLCERLAVYNHALTVGGNYELSFMYSLRKFEFELLNLTTIATEFNTIGNTDPFDIVSTSLTAINSAFSGNTRIKRIGNIDCPNVTTANSFLLNASNVEEIGDIDLLACTNLGNMINSLFMLRKIGVINAPLNTTLSGFAASVYSLPELIFTDCSLVTVTTSAFATMSSLERLIVPGITVGFTVAGTAMGAQALNDMFTSLGTASGSQTIIVSNTPGASTCDTTIATAKGFTVTI